MATPEAQDIELVAGEGNFDFLWERRMLLAVVLSLPIAGAAASVADDIAERSFSGFQGKSLESRIEELVAREEIHDLIGRYAHRVAQGVSIAPLYTDDGAFIARFPGKPVLEVRGRKALDVFFAKAASGEPSFTMVHNIDLDFSNNNECFGACADKLVMLEDGKLRQYRGVYRDRLRRENSRWAFVVRDITFYHSAPIEGDKAVES